LPITNAFINMPYTNWKEAIANWRKLAVEQRFQRHLAAIPRHVAMSMAMEGEPVEEALVRKQLARLMSPSSSPRREAQSASEPCDPSAD
jgi:hypothetical protein